MMGDPSSRISADRRESASSMSSGGEGEMGAMRVEDASPSLFVFDCCSWNMSAAFANRAFFQPAAMPAQLEQASRTCFPSPGPF